jgi:hypothetical protein
MVSLSYSQRTAEQCVIISGSSISAVYVYHSSELQKTTDRYGSTFYLTCAILPLLCIIVSDHISMDEIRPRAIESLRKALYVLEDISPGFFFARHTLDRLRPLLQLVNKAITTKWPHLDVVLSSISPSTDELESLPDINLFNEGNSMDSLLGIYDGPDLFMESVQSIVNGCHFNWNDPADLYCQKPTVV